MGKKVVSGETSGKKAVKNKKDVDIKMYVVSALISKKGARDLYYDDHRPQRQYTQPQALEAACATLRTWETQTQYYRDVRLHEIGVGKKVKITTELVEE